MPRSIVAVGVAAAGIALALPTPAAAAPLYSEAAGCISRAETTRYAPITPRDRDSVEVWATPTTRPRAEFYDLAVVTQIFRIYQPLFGGVPHGDRPQRVYIVPTAPASASDFVPAPGSNVGAVTAPYCDHRAIQAVVIPDSTPDELIEVDAAHELFHAFQSVPYGRPVPGNWWIEATAAYAETRIVHGVVDPRVAERDNNFLGQPEVPLDSFDHAGSRLKFTHPYGASRFVEWLRTKMSQDAHTRLLMETFREMGRGTSPTQAVRTRLLTAGRELGEDLGQFWADTLKPSVAGWPRFPHRVVFVPEGRSVVELSRIPLTAERLELQLADGVREAVIKVELTSPDAHLWALAGEQPEKWRDDHESSFCVGESVAGTRVWPDGLRLAFTSGARAGAVRARLTIDATTAACRPAIALDKSRCGAPPYWNPPAGFTYRIVFLQRWWRIESEWFEWLHRVGGFRTPESFTRQSLVTRCALDRLAGLNRIPPPMRPAVTTFANDLEWLASEYARLAALCASDELTSNGRCRYRPTAEERRPSSDREVQAANRARVAYKRDRKLVRELRRCQELKHRTSRRPRCAGPRIQKAWYDPPA